MHISLDHIRHQWSNALERLKALSKNRLSVSLLFACSVVLFFAILFVALPSARIRVWPRTSLVSHTANVLLVLSGASIDVEAKHRLLLLPLRTDVRRSVIFDEIGRKFTGENAEVEMSVINESDEPYELVQGTRFVNQAGMIFRTLSSVTVPARSPIAPGVERVRARAAAEDLYGQIIGERGNVPAGLKWEFIGLPLEERTLVYARNLGEATGGRTAYGRELRERDLELAEKKLRQELLQRAMVQTEERVENLRSRTGRHHTVLQYDVLTVMTYSGFVLPLDLIGRSVTSIPVEGELAYTVLAYDKSELMDLLLPGLLSHIEEGQELIPRSVMLDGLSVHVIEYDDDLAWVRITAELTGKQRTVLSSVSPRGRSFSLRVREAIRGKTVREAERIIQNFPEVERVEVGIWPPWRGALPSLMSNIVLLPQE